MNALHSSLARAHRSGAHDASEEGADNTRVAAVVRHRERTQMQFLFRLGIDVMPVKGSNVDHGLSILDLASGLTV